MTAASRKRWFVLLPLLAVSGWLALFGDKTPHGTAAVAESVARSRAPPASPSGNRPGAGTAVLPGTPKQISRPEEPAEPLIPRAALFPNQDARPAIRDLFAAANWSPPAPAPEVAVQPSAPLTPALPYTYLGKKFEAGSWEVYLGKGDQTFIVTANAVLESDYQVQDIQPPRLTLKYLPTGEIQTLGIGEAR